MNTVSNDLKKSKLEEYFSKFSGNVIHNKKSNKKPIESGLFAKLGKIIENL